ncbi:hypothetical protein AAFN85_26955 [Mucilaginibacter sp. CAU 1740]|uniref:hypothetical protein n=1 Tax=Mucilaginibacter sp. CAU 1740 TaxID=3140365 RepID=UPI00325AD7B5
METTTTQTIIEQLKQCLETKIKLLKYEGIDKASGVIADIVTDIVLIIIGLVAFIFLSVTLALFAGYLLKSYWMGFGCVTSLYVLILFSGHLLKVSLQNMFIRIFIKKMFKDRS